MKSKQTSIGISTSSRSKLNKVARRKTAIEKAMFEGLESRRLFSYTFTVAGNNASATGDASTDSLIIAPIGGLLEHSVNGSSFDSDWGGSTVPASNAVTVTVNLSSGDGSSFRLGNGANPASDSQAHFVVLAPANTLDTTTIDDSQASASGTYTFDTNAGTIGGPGIDYSEVGSQPFSGGVTLIGSPVAGNTYNIVSVLAGEPADVMTAIGTTANTFNVGSSGVLNINAPLALFGNGVNTTLNINDQSDTTHSTATLDDLSGNIGAPFEVAGLSSSAIEYTGLTAVNINGGTNAASGVTYDIYNTIGGVTTTITGGINQNFINLANSSEIGGLDNLAGPVVVHGGSSSTDVVTLDDSDANFNDSYTVTSTTVVRTVFGGLTYDGNIGTLTLDAENALGTNGNNIPININSTADSVFTNINSQGGSDIVTVNGTGTGGLLVITTGVGSSTVNVLANNQDVNIELSGTDTVTLGGAPSAGMQNLNGTINISDSPALTDVILDDSQNSSSRSVALNDSGTINTITGISPATIHLTDSDINTLSINGGSGGNAFTVNNTGAFPTTLNKGAGDNNTVNVLGTSSGSSLTLTGSGMNDTVTLGNGSLTNLHGPVSIQEAAGSTNMILDFSSDALIHDFVLSSDGTTSTLHDSLGNLPNDITFLTSSLASFTIDANPNLNEDLTVDFGQGGNPIPSAGAGLIFNGGNGTGTHGLNLLGVLPSGAFASETHTANDSTVSPQFGQYGSISFNDGQGNSTSITKLVYTGLQPIDDITPAFVYTFNDAATDPSFTAQNGPVIAGFQTIQFVNTPTAPPPTFETTNVANKTSIVFNATTDQGLNGLVDINIPSTGLTSLTFNTPNSHEDAVHFLVAPAGIATALVGGSDEDTTAVTGAGIGAGTTLTLNGGAGVDTLNYDAGGLIPTITAGGIAGEVLISIPGHGTIDAFDYANINITNITPIVITPAAAVTINTVEGTPFTSRIVGTFTAPIGITPSPVGYPASDFLASINWGDGTIAPGTIVQDPSNPSIYDVIGNHTYSVAGTFTITSSVAFTGGTYVSSLNGVSLAVTAPTSPNTNLTAGSAVVTQGAITLNAFPIVGTEGTTIPSAPIATFTQAGTQEAPGSYTATITAINSLGATVFSVAGTITVNGSVYSVVAPALTFPDEGSYRLVVAVTETTSSTTAVASSQATIADAALTGTSGAALTPNTGIAFTGVTVGTFTDANPSAPISDFTAIITWGDGTSSAGTITQPGGVGTAFRVTGSHVYTNPGTFAMLISVTDDGGSSTTLAGSAAVTDLPVTGTGNSFSVVQNQSTGDIVLATFSDPNPFATASSLTATIPAGGWGDGSPAAPMLLTIVPVGSTSTSTLFEIVGSHTYAHVGTFPVNITVRTSGGTVTNLTATATVTTPAPHLVFFRTPKTVVAGKIIAPFIIVYAEDSTGNLIKTDHSTVTLSMNTGPGGGYLTGGRTATLANGVAVFSKVTIKKAGVYTIEASDGIDTPAISKKVSVVPATLKMIFTVQPRSGLAGNPFSTQVRLVDKFGNLATNDHSSVTLSLINHPAGASFSPITVNVDDGIAEFDHLILKAKGQYQFVATDAKAKLPNRNSSKFTMHSDVSED